MSKAYTRAERRRLQRLGDRVDRVTQGDARFFERFPDREYRVRVTAAVELEIDAGSDRKEEIVPLEPELRWYTIVRQIAPGVRIRVKTQGPADHDVDLPEDVARHLYGQIVTPGSYFAHVEQQVAEALANAARRAR